MADEPRRSGRATKGQHTKNETPDPPGKKGKRGRKKQKSEEPEPDPEEEEEAIIRCVCGYVLEDARDKRAMICCDKCMAWQHNVHMGLSEDDDDLPDQYFCEECKPEDHKELLDAMERGEKIWETREAEAKAAKTASRRKGKGGRKSAAAEVNPSSSTEASSLALTNTANETKHETGQKRKLHVDGGAESPGTENAKIRKVSTHKPLVRQQSISNTNEIGRRDSYAISTTLQAELVEKIEDLNDKSRQGAAKGLRKTFTDAASDASRSGTFKLPTGQDLGTFALKLALNVEYALYMNLWARGASAQTEYGTQCRAIMHNVKQNMELRDNIFNNRISPLDLSKMTSEDMQSREMQEKTAEWKKQIERQTTLVSEPSTAGLRNSKGELIENPNAAPHDIDELPASRRIRRPSVDDGADDQDRATSPNAVELPSEINRIRAAPNSKLFIDTKRRASSGQTSARKSSATFDVDKVWSSVESPGTPARPIPSQSKRHIPSNTKADPEIDRLLKDDNEEDEDYEPADYTPDPDTIWGGSVIMATVADLRATAKYAAGANLSQVYAWSTLMPPLLNIEGRIDVEAAETYLCNLQYSKSKDVTVVSLTPADHQEDKDNFNKLFEYFTSRKRYGVIRKSPVDQARDIYVIPLEAGSGSLPEFLELLQENVMEHPRKTRMLLVAYVINCTTDRVSGPQPAAAASATPTSSSAVHASSHQPRRTSSVSAQMSPNPPTPQQTPQYSSIPPNPYAQSPSAPQQHFAPSPQPNPAYPPQYQMPQSNGNGGGSLTGMAAAIHILGDLANSRAVSQLLASSPNVGVNEFGHIKDVFNADPSTRDSLDALLPRLQARISGQGT